MKAALYTLIGLAVFIMIAFYLLGKKSQNGSARGLIDGKLSKCSGKPNCVLSEEGTAKRFQIEPLSTDLVSLKTAIVNEGGVITKEEDGYLAAEFTSGVFKFVDDVEARLDGGVVQIRSCSRVGFSDRGVNRARVETLRAALGK